MSVSFCPPALWITVAVVRWCDGNLVQCLVPLAGICKPELIGECVSFKWGCYLVLNIGQGSVIFVQRTLCYAWWGYKEIKTLFLPQCKSHKSWIIFISLYELHQLHQPVESVCVDKIIDLLVHSACLLSTCYLCSRFGKSRKVNITQVSQALCATGVILMGKVTFSRFLSLLFRDHFQQPLSLPQPNSHPVHI